MLQELQGLQELQVLQVEGALQESFTIITDSFLVVQQEVSEVKEAGQWPGQYSTA